MKIKCLLPIEEQEEITGKREEIAGNHHDPCRITRKKQKVWGLLKIEMLDKNQILKCRKKLFALIITIVMLVNVNQINNLNNLFC